MQELQTYKIRVRQYAGGAVFSASHHDLEEHLGSFDDIVNGVDDDEPYREFDVELTSRPPEPADATPPAASVTIPDEAPAGAVSATAV